MRILMTLVLALNIQFITFAEPTTSPETDNAVISLLTQHNWILTSAVDTNKQTIDTLFPIRDASTTSLAIGQIKLSFTPEMIHIQGACNSSRGHYQLTQSQLMVNTNALPSTLMGCQSQLMAADDYFLKILSAPLKLTILSQPHNNVDAQLNLTTQSGNVLTFNGHLTPEAQYGKATRIFLEVAPQKVTCSDPLIANRRCLQVKERHYDEQGLLINTASEWETFYDEIEGFNHNEGVRTVLRINRFTRQNVPADASRYFYVLDMIIESSTQ